MSNYIGDLSQFYISQASAGAYKASKQEDNTSLDMTDFLTLMVAQFQNQSLDSTADTSDMLNQLVQMSVIQAITEISDATVMTYASSLVGKEVTVGRFNNQGMLEEYIGTVTGTGVSNGEQIVFVDGQSYALGDILAVGRLPELNDDASDSESEENSGTEAETKTPEVE